MYGDALHPPLSIATALAESGLSPVERLGLIKAELDRRRPLWRPNRLQAGRPGINSNGTILSPQSAAYVCEADELFFGGSGGGGKTDLVIGLCCTAHRASIIFRREYKQFMGPTGIMERTREIVGDRGEVTVNGARNIDGGRHIEFGAVQLETDKYKYKGRAHDLKAFDELPEFTESQFRFLIAWNRSSVVGQRVRVVCTGNPPTDPEGEWVIRYWAPWLDPTHPNPAAPGELRWFVVDDNSRDIEVDGPKHGSRRPKMVLIGGQHDCEHLLDLSRRCEKCKGRFVDPKSRTFIPAIVEDNPYYMATGYATILDNLPEPLRSQMRFGNFQAQSDDHIWQILPTAWVKAAQARWTETPPSRILTGVGCDPSRGGQDKFCVALKHDNWIANVIKHQGKEAPDGAAGAMLVVRDILEHENTYAGKQLSRVDDVDPSLPIGVDIIGSAGSSVYDHLVGFGLNAVSLNGSEATMQRDASGKLGFFNKRAEWHWRMREWLDPNSGMDLMLPPDRELLVDLCAPRWTITPRGIKVESKDEIKSRIGRSPDVGEAVMYAFAQDSSAGFGFLMYAGQTTTSTEAPRGPEGETTALNVSGERAAAPTAPNVLENPWFAGMKAGEREGQQWIERGES